jgi:transposase-like protein
MSILSKPHFHCEEAAYERLEAIVWPNGPVCPHCGGFDRITVVGGKTARPGLKRCLQCKKQFRATVGTVFESSHVKLHLWFQAAHLLASSKKGISAHQLHRTLKVTYKTAWFMAHRLREAMRDGHFSPLGGEGQVVEIDETFVGGKEKNKHANKRQHLGTGGVGKEAVLSLVERGGKVRSHHIPAVTAANLRPIVEAQIHGATYVMTDEGGAAKKVGSEFAKHDFVNHCAGEYVRGGAHINTAESYFAVFKRGIYGTYHHVSQQHFKRYLAEFDFRYNERSALGVEDEARGDKLIRGITGKRLLYRDSSAARP